MSYTRPSWLYRQWAYLYVGTRRQLFRIWRRWARPEPLALRPDRLCDSDRVPVPGYRRYAEILNERTEVYPVSDPLLTPGQQARSPLVYWRDRDGNSGVGYLAN